MKYLLITFMTILSITNTNILAQSLYDISINNIDGEKIDLSKFKGKYILFVNVASKCGFTRQYADLEKLFQKFGDKLVVIGLPCNQFGGQEPGQAKEIKQFCKENYGVTFPISEKINVKGENIHPIYSWLTIKDKNGNINSKVKWNFQKYLVGKRGELINYFYSTTSPLSKKIISEIN
ncbi:MAG: glutathione peroxidase [Chloroflexi bacterium]|nr:glutathione peroxidase [Chloroflexota bacterium]